MKQIIGIDVELQYTFLTQPDMKINPNIDEAALRSIIRKQELVLNYGYQKFKVRKKNYTIQDLRASFLNEKANLRVQIKNIQNYYSKLTILYFKIQEVLDSRKIDIYDKDKKDVISKLKSLDVLKYRNAKRAGNYSPKVNEKIKEYAKKLQVDYLVSTIKQKHQSYYITERLKKFEKDNGKLRHLKRHVRSNSDLISKKLFLKPGKSFN